MCIDDRRYLFFFPFRVAKDLCAEGNRQHFFFSTTVPKIMCILIQFVFQRAYIQKSGIFNIPNISFQTAAQDHVEDSEISSAVSSSSEDQVSFP